MVKTRQYPSLKPPPIIDALWIDVWFQWPMLTPFELVRMSAAPFLPPLAWRVRHDLRRLLPKKKGLQILDVGSRRSPYTIGLPASVTMLDVPRESGLQRNYDLGLTQDTLRALKKRRSNVTNLVLEDFSKCTLPDESFDVVTAIEVIEHVEDDTSFMHHLHRVLRPGGIAYLTTPNGDLMPIPAPQHVRHYTAAQMKGLSERFFSSVQVEYGIRRDKLHRIGHRKLSPVTMVANALQKLTSANRVNDAKQCAHLIVTLRK